jgi:hypothetical protein
MFRVSVAIATETRNKSQAPGLSPYGSPLSNSGMPLAPMVTVTVDLE